MKIIRNILKRVRNKQKTTQLTILVTFLITFILIRLVTHLQKAHLLPSEETTLHIHHLVPGIIFVLISGYVGLSFWNNEKIRHYVSILFGIGAALTIDEFALWLFLKDVYWAKQGRYSIDFVIIAIIIMSTSYIISEAHDHKLSLIGN